MRPVENSVPQAGGIQAAFVRYQRRLTCTGRPRMARASLRRGAIRKEMLPHCVQQRERGHPSEPGCVNPVRARTPNPVRRAPHREPIPPVNRGDTPRLAASCPRAFLTATRTFLSRRLHRQVRLPSSICVHLWRRRSAISGQLSAVRVRSLPSLSVALRVSLFVGPISVPISVHLCSSVVSSSPRPLRLRGEPLLARAKHLCARPRICPDEIGTAIRLSRL